MVDRRLGFVTSFDSEERRRHCGERGRVRALARLPHGDLMLSSGRSPNQRNECRRHKAPHACALRERAVRPQGVAKPAQWEREGEPGQIVRRRELADFGVVAARTKRHDRRPEATSPFDEPGGERLRVVDVDEHEPRTDVVKQDIEWFAVILGPDLVAIVREKLAQDGCDFRFGGDNNGDVRSGRWAQSAQGRGTDVGSSWPHLTWPPPTVPDVLAYSMLALGRYASPEDRDSVGTGKTSSLYR